MMGAQILIADDEPLIRESLRVRFLDEGCQVSVAGSGAEALAVFEREHPELVLLDLSLGDADGLDIIKHIKNKAPQTKIIVITAYGSVDRGVAALEIGAHDFIKKPFELEEIVVAVRHAIQTIARDQRIEYLARQDLRHSEVNEFVYRSAEMSRIVEEVCLIASKPIPVVLVTGESGTGKQLIARLLHERSNRAAAPFVELNCAAIPTHLVETELFGHERSAFTDARERKLGLVEVADGGTLFLDEVGDLSCDAQAKLLTFLEDRSFRRVGGTTQRSVDIRIVAATNRDLDCMAKHDLMRKDLLYRMRSIVVKLPPLRQRPEDVAPLAERFLASASRAYRRRWRCISPEAMRVLERYHWPGNIRELRAVVGRVALLSDEEIVRPRHLPRDLAQAAFDAPPFRAGERSAEGCAPGIPTLADVELRHIRWVLKSCGGNRTLAAQHLGITRQTLAKRLWLDRAANEGREASEDGDALSAHERALT
ncbi:MAG: sigma-54 dependent transcriptional regulator [Kofleriaceae bacterium]